LEHTKQSKLNRGNLHLERTDKPWLGYPEKTKNKKQKTKQNKKTNKKQKQKQKQKQNKTKQAKAKANKTKNRKKHPNLLTKLFNSNLPKNYGYPNPTVKRDHLESQHLGTK
jgi:hypothetical protein